PAVPVKTGRAAACGGQGATARVAECEPCGRLLRPMPENPREGVMNNSSMFTADRMTHLKIVVVSLVCATMVAGIGIAARVTDNSVANGRLEATVIKATTTPVTATIETPTIR